MTKRNGDKSQSIEIFRVGTHTDMHGAELSFGVSDLQATASTYDVAKHEAPIVIGHPKVDGPAYGWVKSLDFSDGRLRAEPSQVDPAFAEMVTAGRFKKVSASFYPPNAARNPTPGVFSLRHVGFLGAMAPAVQGLKQIAFADDEDAITLTLDFADAEMETGWALKRIFRVLRGMREYLIEEHGQERANKVIEDWDLEIGAEEATNVLEEARDVEDEPNFSETITTEETTMKTSPKTPAPGASQVADDSDAEFAEREKNIQEQEIAFAERERLATATIAVASLVKDGKVLPAEKDGMVQFMASLDGNYTVSFGEGDAAVKKTSQAFLSDFLNTLPVRVDFSEVAAGDGLSIDLEDGQEIGLEAISYQEEMSAKGVTVTTTQAVDHVMKGQKL